MCPVTVGFVDETYAKIAGRWVYLYRAIDQFGQVIDVLVSEKRDLAATRRFFTRALERFYATKRGSRPLIGVAPIVSQSTPQCRRRRSR
jgi:transposase-like protein